MITLTGFIEFQTRKRKPKGSKDTSSNTNGIPTSIPSSTTNIKLEHNINTIKLEHSPIGKHPYLIIDFVMCSYWD